MIFANTFSYCFYSVSHVWVSAEAANTEINQVSRWDSKFIHTWNTVYLHMRKKKNIFPLQKRSPLWKGQKSWPWAAWHGMGLQVQNIPQAFGSLLWTVGWELKVRIIRQKQLNGQTISFPEPQKFSASLSILVAHRKISNWIFKLHHKSYFRHGLIYLPGDGAMQ